MSTMDVAKRYVELVKAQKNEEALEELFAKDAVSVEAGAPPGQERSKQGVEAIRAKGQWWIQNHVVHSAVVDGPYPHDDRFAVRFTYDITFKPHDKRFTMNEIGLFTVKDDKITKEEFFYSME